jgi:hypothetical protein
MLNNGKIFYVCNRFIHLYIVIWVFQNKNLGKMHFNSKYLKYETAENICVFKLFCTYGLKR